MVIGGWCLGIRWTQCTCRSQPHILRLSRPQAATVNWITHPKVGVTPPAPGPQVSCSPPPWGGICHRNRSPGCSSDSLSRPCPLACVALGICKGEKVRPKAMKKPGCHEGCEAVERWRKWWAQPLEDRASALRPRATRESLWAAVSSSEGWEQPFQPRWEAGIIP